MSSYILGVIPARLNSTRLPGKLLLPIAGKPLLWHTYQQAKKSAGLDDLVIATDSAEIRHVAESWGCSVIMTSSKHKTGTDRIAEAVTKYKGKKPDIVVNIQGDEPLMPPVLINRMVRDMMHNSKWDAAAAATTTYTDEDLRESSVVLVSSAGGNRALYFSRSLIPFHHVQSERPRYLAIIGLMAFRAPFLQRFVALKRGPLERVESVEQLRIIEHGYQCGLVSGAYEVLGVNTYEEYERVKELVESKKK
jgi:3-deoxy-manno-octulosonate cytidylyltransferase (CMP-KDO synthetase)